MGIGDSLCGLLIKMFAAQTLLGDSGVLAVRINLLAFSGPIDLDPREEPMSTVATQVCNPPATAEDSS